MILKSRGHRDRYKVLEVSVGGTTCRTSYVKIVTSFDITCRDDILKGVILLIVNGQRVVRRDLFVTKVSVLWT